MGTIYLAKKNGQVVAHADKQAMWDLDEVKPEMEISETDYEAAGGIARIIKGKIFLGKTEEEKAEEKTQAEAAKFKAQLNQIDQQAKAGREIRAIARDLGVLVGALRNAAMDFADLTRALYNQSPGLNAFDPDKNEALQMITAYDPADNKELQKITELENKAEEIRARLKLLSNNKETTNGLD